MFRRPILLVCIILLSVNLKVFADDYKGGAAIFPISDGLPKSAFNVNTDAASIYLEKATLYKNNGWFTNDKEIAVTGRMTINSQREDRTASSLTISRVYKFDISVYDDGRIEIPLKNLPLLDTYMLSGEKYIVTSIVLNIFLSKKRDKNNFSKTFETLIAVSKRIPIPGNPYAEYARVFGDAFSEVIDNAIKEGADTVPFATFGLRFLHGEKAANYTEKSGVYAIIIGSDSKAEGIIDFENMEQINLIYNDVTGLKYDNNRVLNNHLIVRVTASIDPWRAIAMGPETYERILYEAPAAIAFSEANNFNVPYLKGLVVEKYQFDVLEGVYDGLELEAAIKELNYVKAINPLKEGMIIPYDNRI